jgi:hypothetical protein
MTFETKIRPFDTNPNLWTLGNIDAPADVVLHSWKCIDITPPGKPSY